MLAMILSTALFARGISPNLLQQYKYGKKHRPADQFLATERLEKKAANFEMEKAEVEKLHAEAMMKAEELKRKEERLHLLTHYAGQYMELQRKMQENDAVDAVLQAKMEQLLIEMSKLNNAEVQEAKKEVKEAEKEVVKAAEEAGQPIPALAVEQPLPTVEVSMVEATPTVDAPAVVEAAPVLTETESTPAAEAVAPAAPTSDIGIAPAAALEPIAPTVSELPAVERTAEPVTAEQPAATPITAG